MKSLSLLLASLLLAEQSRQASWNKPYVTGSLKMGEPRLCDPMTDKQNIKNCQLSPIITGKPMVFV